MGYLDKLIDIHGGVDEACIYVDDIIDSLNKAVKYKTISSDECEARKGMLNKFKDDILKNK